MGLDCAETVLTLRGCRASAVGVLFRSRGASKPARYSWPTFVFAGIAAPADYYASAV
jgi:hypothetical protein